ELFIKNKPIRFGISIIKQPVSRIQVERKAGGFALPVIIWYNGERHWPDRGQSRRDGMVKDA
ncbi:hypothetical protein, partial [Enterocloster clostridioformis]